MFDYLGQRSYGFYALLLVMVVLVLSSLTIGSLYFFKSSGIKRANNCFGGFLLVTGLTLLHSIFVISDFFDHYPSFKFLPIYYTLSMPVLLFFYIKLHLYPSYHLRFSDIKHFFLPIGQLIYFTYLFFLPVAYTSQIDRHFYNPFFGAFEQAIYISSFFSYFYFSRKYIEQKKREPQTPGLSRKIRYAEKLIQFFSLLFIVHTGFILVDFFAYEFMGINLRTIKIFSGLGIMSFVALVFWVNIYGFQTLIWGRKLFQ